MRPARWRRLATALAVFRLGDRGAPGRALCAATMLISPYLFFYDATLLALEAALLLAARDRLEKIAIARRGLHGLSLAVGLIVYAVPIKPAAAYYPIVRRCGASRLQETRLLIWLPAPRMEHRHSTRRYRH